MNANLKPDILIALGIAHQIRYPLYYIKKLSLRCTDEQKDMLARQRRKVAAGFVDSSLSGKYLTRKIDDNTFINFADLILRNPEDAEYNIAKIRASLSILKDGQAVFTNLEKVYLYRYVFTKGVPFEEKMPFEDIESIPDRDIAGYVRKMLEDRKNPDYRDNTIFQDKLLWIARSSADRGINYLEISDTTLVKNPLAADMLAEVHRVMPAIYLETGVVIRFLAAIRRIALTIIKDSVIQGDYFRENLQVLSAVAADPYVAGADIIGEEINDIRELRNVIREIVKIARDDPSFVVRIHAGENDSLRDNVANSVACVKSALAEGQSMPHMRIGHGLYTANLRSQKGKALLRELRDSKVVLEFQITSNVRLNNLNSLRHHPLCAYLKAGVRCVQGTDGGALYGTDSIDEQLSLGKLLNLSPDDMMRMRECEAEVYRNSMEGFRYKTEAWYERYTRRKPSEEVKELRKVGEEFEPERIKQYYLSEIESRKEESGRPLTGEGRLNSSEVLKDRIMELPQDGIPVVLMGGSFNSDSRKTNVQDFGRHLIDEVLKMADPEKVFFVVGYRLKGYEEYLIEENQKHFGGRFRIFAIIPTLISEKEEKNLRRSGVNIRVSIESSPMGLYKSFAYEIFKRRFSVLLALDGNSAGANMVQEARNAKYKCRTYVSAHSRILKIKAASLGGYVTVFSDENEVLPAIRKDIM